MLEKLRLVEERYMEMAERAGQPDFYADPKAASKLLREQKRLEPIVTAYRSFCKAKKEADELREILWLETGVVTPLALLNAPDVTLYLDEALLGSRIAVHPNTNTATVWLQTADLVSLLRTQCVPVVAVPFPCLA